MSSSSLRLGGEKKEGGRKEWMGMITEDGTFFFKGRNDKGGGWVFIPVFTEDNLLHRSVLCGEW